MCGIAGIYAFGSAAPSVDMTELRAIRDQMVRRGPDGHGEWLSHDFRVALAHRRLAIIDLSERAAQPMSSSDGAFVITFNGEIYNYAALREELQRVGCVFRTTSDTEVLLHLYAERGVEMFSTLRGMYAFAIWDARKKSLLLARDPYGIKPLYYSDAGKTLRFASQVKALVAGGRVSSIRDPAGQVGFYLWGSVPEPFTSHSAVRSLPAGTYAWVDATGVHDPQEHFSISRAWCGESPGGNDGSAGEIEARVHSALRDSVAHHMVADVPVSAFLSGGIDSGALVGLMSEERGVGLSGITLQFSEFEGSGHDEGPLAAAVAKDYGVAHHLRLVAQPEFDQDLPKILEAMDQPTIDGVNTWFVSKATAELGLKVAVSGLGGDELLGGYRSFRDIPRIVQLCRAASGVPGLGRAVRMTFAGAFGALGVHPKFAGLVEYGGSYAGAYLLKRGLFMPWELKSLLPASVVEEGLDRLSARSALRPLLAPEPRGPFAKVAALEAVQYMRNQLLRDTDWASMAHSLEVRVPLVDTVLLQAVGPLLASHPQSSGKMLLANAPRRPLPAAVQAHPKTGFSTPVQAWLHSSTELASWNRVASLRSSNCPWARRFAYAVAEHAGFNA